MQVTVWDVFLFDPDFKIERPKRYYRQGLGNILHNELAIIEHPFSSPEKPEVEALNSPALQQQYLQPPLAHPGSRSNRDGDGRSLLGSLKSRISRVFHLESGSGQRAFHDQARNSKEDKEDGHHDDSDSSSGVSLPARARTPMLDPSTNLNPMVRLGDQDPRNDGQPGEAVAKKKNTEDVSKHTFYIVNSQMRLKLYARNEVCCHCNCRLRVNTDI
jgi:phospholipase D1/2